MYAGNLLQTLINAKRFDANFKMFDLAKEMILQNNLHDCREANVSLRVVKPI
jgi:hypothetical protein